MAFTTRPEAYKSWRSDEEDAYHGGYREGVSPTAVAAAKSLYRTTNAPFRELQR